MWAIHQDRKVALLKEMERIKVKFQFFEEQGDDGKGCIKKWTQHAGKYRICCIFMFALLVENNLVNAINFDHVIMLISAVCTFC